MKIEMIMPQMGESIAEGTILKWRKKVGDWVEKDEDILEISTDKVDSEIPSPATGVIVEIKVAEGQTVPIKTVLAVIETEAEAGAQVAAAAGGDDGKTAARPSPMESSPHDASDAGGLKVKEFKKMTAAPSPSQPPAPKPVGAAGAKSTFVSPLVQAIAAEHGIPISVVQTIPGSGRDGRVTKKDILAFIETGAAAQTPTAPPPKPSEMPAEAPVITPSQVWRAATDEVIEMDRMRRMIADNMVRSVKTSPHVVSYNEVDMNAVVTHRERIKDDFKRREGLNLTFTAYIIYLVGKALREFPYVNASVDGYNIILRRQLNIGFAVELPGAGLIVPVIKGVDGLNLTGVARGLHTLAEKARAGRLDPEDVAGGTFTVTNVGVFGSIAGAPIINQPQVAILGTGAIRKVPAVIETPSGDAIAIRWRMIMSLSYDHRLIDGAYAGRFMAHLKQLLENFED